MSVQGVNAMNEPVAWPPLLSSANRSPPTAAFTFLALVVRFALLLAFSFPGLVPQAAAAEVETSCGLRTGKTVGDPWTYEKHNIYGVGCLDVKVSSAAAAEDDSDLYMFRVTSRVAPGPWGLPHRQYFVYFTLGGTATEGEDYELVYSVTNQVGSKPQPPVSSGASYSGHLYDSSKIYNPSGAPRGLVTAAFFFRILDDDEVEPDETVTFTLGYLNPSGLGAGAADYEIGTASATFTIRNDDVAPTPQRPRVSIEPGQSSIKEGASAAFTVTATPAPAAALTVEVAVSETGGYATAATHQVTIPTSGTATLSIATTGDAVDEPDGSVTAALAKGDGYTVSAKASAATATITDDDPTLVTLTGDNAAVNEGGTKTFTLAIGRGLVRSESLSVPLTFAGTAQRNTDYTLACPGSPPTGVVCNNLNTGTATVTFTGPTTGMSATSVTLTLSASADSATESGGETVNIGLGTLGPTPASTWAGTTPTPSRWTGPASS